MAGLKIPDSDIHNSYYVTNVLAISFGLAHIRVCRVFPRRSANGGIFDSRLLFSLLFSGNFCGGQVLMEGDKAVMGDPPSPPTRESPDVRDSQI